MKKDTDVEDAPYMTCPWCGFEHKAMAESFADGDTTSTFDCLSCDKPFSATARCEIKWFSYRLEE